MALLTETCSSCGVNIRTLRASTSFPCPGCREQPIGRCLNCRDQSVIYHCNNCDFQGP